MHQTDGLSFHAHCPNCLQSYSQPDAKLVDRKPGLTTYHVSCRSCHHALFFYVRAKEGGMQCAGVFTDCSFEDGMRFRHASPISADDVLAAHLALQLDNFMEIR